MNSVDTIFLVLGTVLVFIMHGGFAMLEAGLTQPKNSGNAIMKIIMDICLGSIAFFVIGFSLIYNKSFFGIIGMPNFFFLSSNSLKVPSAVFMIYQTVFCVAVASIVSGAIAERAKFISYCFLSLAISAIIYPVAAHWVWGNGWLQQLGFHDFAGGAAIHLVGGIAAFVGAAVIGPRVGKYTKSGKARAIPGQSLTLAALGVFILWFGWFGFNGSCSVTASGTDLNTMGNVMLTTNLSATAAAIVAMIFTWALYKKPDISMTMNGVLAGLVSITCCCDVVSPLSAILIGSVASVIMVLSIEFIDKKLRIDDPVGAISVHGVSGAVGLIMSGFLAKNGGLFYGGGLHMLGVQFLGIFALVLWIGLSSFIVFKVIDKLIGLRVTASEEINGLDVEQHGLESNFIEIQQVNMDMKKSVKEIITNETKPVSVEDAVPVELRASKESVYSDVKMTKIEIITRQSKFDELKAALNEIGVKGITVANVLGYGMQKGRAEYYRGVEIEPTLLPKISVTAVVCKIPVDLVVQTARKVLYTGKVGDGKIFIYDVENVVKIRTGEEGYEALQDD
ncbi:MAG: ammonium transporter [Bacillota bacterium]|nr:ammonium transporter [Bacillota bacterium]